MKLLRYGVSAQGTVERIKVSTALVSRTTEVTLDYDDLMGVPHSAVVHLRGEHASREHMVGERVPVLIDPRGSARVIAPSLLRVDFEEVQDQRPDQIDAQPLEPNFVEAILQVSARHQLHNALQQAPGGLLDRLLGAGKPAELGELEIDDQGIRLKLHSLELGAKNKAEVLWEQPFVVQLSAWPVSSRSVELNVSLRRRGAPAEEASVRFKTLVPQSCVSASVSVKQEAVPYLSQALFDDLWPVVCFYAKLHGQSVEREARASSVMVAAAAPVPSRVSG